MSNTMVAERGALITPLSLLRGHPVENVRFRALIIERSTLLVWTFPNSPNVYGLRLVLKDTLVTDAQRICYAYAPEMETLYRYRVGETINVEGASYDKSDGVEFALRVVATGEDWELVASARFTPHSDY